MFIFMTSQTVQTTGLECDWRVKLSRLASYWFKIKRLRDKSYVSTLVHSSYIKFLILALTVKK